MLPGQEAQRNHLECTVVTRLRWREGVVLPSGHVGAVGENHLHDDTTSVIQLCLERGVRLVDGLHHCYSTLVSMVCRQNYLNLTGSLKPAQTILLKKTRLYSFRRLAVGQAIIRDSVGGCDWEK